MFEQFLCECFVVMGVRDEGGEPFGLGRLGKPNLASLPSAKDDEALSAELVLDSPVSMLVPAKFREQVGFFDQVPLGPTQGRECVQEDLPPASLSQFPCHSLLQAGQQLFDSSV